jgi:putative exporter of polyketide antibiotics
MSLTPKDRRRRLAAKRINERLKLTANFLNAIGIGVVGAAFIIPGVTDLTAVRWDWLPFGFTLHVLAHVALSFLKSED